MEGCLLSCGPHVCFAVDYWRGRPNKRTLAYFLTHFHADHTHGLGPQWNLGPLFCSFETGRLIRQRWPGFRAPIHTLEVGVPTDIRVTEGSHFQVTPVDAQHCLGSLMYIFDGCFGRILHTGDFRWEVEAQPRLLSDPALAAQPVDLLILDNTYCHPKHQHPPRTAACLDVIKVASAYPDHDVVVGVDSLGKEELLAAIARALGSPICVPPERLEAVRLLDLPTQLFTTDASSSRIRLLPRHQVSVRAVALWNKTRPTVAIIASAHAGMEGPRGTAYSAGQQQQPCQGPPDELSAARKLLISVPYSLHCNFEELSSFVRAIAPRDIQGIVRGCSTMGVPHEPKTFFRHLLAQPSERGKELEQSVSADMAAALKRRREPEQRLSADIAAVHAGPGQCREGQQQLLAGRQEQCIRRKTVHGRVEDQLDADYMTLCPPKRGQIRKLKDLLVAASEKSKCAVALVQPRA